MPRQCNPPLLAGFVAHLHRRMPWLEVLHGDAADLTTLLRGAGVGPVDVMVSSLPWTLLPPVQRRSMLATIAATLAPDGVFTTITTLTALPTRVRDLRRSLDRLDLEGFRAVHVFRTEEQIERVTLQIEKGPVARAL